MKVIEASMVFVINSDDFKIDIQYPINNSCKPIAAKGFPTFYSNTGDYIFPVNLWLNHLTNIRRNKDINSSVRAIKRYWNFLEENDLQWDIFPHSKTLKPTYRFRNDDLLYSARKGNIQFSTASVYMLHVIKFYEWAMYERLIKLDPKSKPFQYEVINVNNNGVLTHINRSFAVQSTDLRIRKPAKNEDQSLNPLSEEDLFAMISELNNFSEEFIIHQLLQLQSGLRVEEACSFSLDLVFRPTTEKLRYEIEIGPHVGIATKFGKTRKIEINHSLMLRMYNYSISERRFIKTNKSNYVAGIHTPLLISNTGKPFTTNNIQQYYRRLRLKIRENHSIPFKHRTHDSRATYGTYRLSSLLQHLEPADAMALIMGWMGHKDEKTTWKYIRYLNKDKIHQQAICILDQIVEEALQHEE